jgi:phosphoesterase RecJ-like protein
MNDWEPVKELLLPAQRVIILTHVSPDGDAIGSMCGLGNALISMGKQIIMAVDGGTPANLRFLPGALDVRSTLDGASADLVIVVDCGDEKRVGKVGEAARKLNLKWINLDHHATNTGFGDANIMDPAFVSASECVLRLLRWLGINPTTDAAQCLLCGLVTDTMGFRISSVTADTFGLAQQLMAAGANLTMIVQNTIARMPTSALRLWGQVMPTVQIKDHVAWVRLSENAKRDAGYTDETGDGGLVSFLLQADDVNISCVFKEKEDNQVELSIRSKPGFDVGIVAFGLGGGGHKQASGATIPGTLDEVESRVIPLLVTAANTTLPTT